MPESREDPGHSGFPGIPVSERDDVVYWYLIR